MGQMWRRKKENVGSFSFLLCLRLSLSLSTQQTTTTSSSSYSHLFSFPARDWARLWLNRARHRNAFFSFSFSLHHLKGNRPCVTQSRAWLPQSNHGGYCHSARFLFKRWREANHSFPPRHISLIISKMFRPEQQRSNLAIESNVTDLIDSYRGAGAARKLRASISFGFFFLSSSSSCLTCHFKGAELDRFSHFFYSLWHFLGEL